MPRRLLALVMFAGIAGHSEAQKDPFKNIRYDSVVAYNFALKTVRPLRILNKDSTLNETTVLPGRKLTRDETKQLLNKLNDKDTYGGPPFACFEPRHAFLFYRKKTIVASIEICFDCNTLLSTPEIPAVHYYYNKKNKEYQNYGFSDQGLAWLMDYCKRIGLEVKPILGRPKE